MKQIIILVLFIINISYADSKKYFIQLGSFRQINVLKHTINRLPPELRSHIVIINSNGWFVPFAYYTTKVYALRKKLPLYKRYFPDAYINSSDYILRHQIVYNYTTHKKPPSPQQRVVEYYTPPPTLPKKQESISTSYTSYTPPLISYEHISNNNLAIPESTQTKKKNRVKKRYNYFTKRMLSGNHFYLTYKSKDNNSDLLVKVTFYNHKVVYQPIIGDMNLREAKYLVLDKKLYMFADEFSKDGAFSKIEKLKKDYILVSSWYNGKKLNTLRYYYDLNKAKKYLKKRQSGQLATALEDGEFDGLHEAFEGVKGIYIGSEDSY